MLSIIDIPHYESYPPYMIIYINIISILIIQKKDVTSIRF